MLEDICELTPMIFFSKIWLTSNYLIVPLKEMGRGSSPEICIFVTCFLKHVTVPQGFHAYHIVLA